MQKVLRACLAVTAAMLAVIGGPAASADGWYCSPVRGEQGDLLGICCATTEAQFKLDCPQNK